MAQGVVIARILGVEGRGIYAAAVLWPVMFALTGLWGVNRTVGRIAAVATDSRAVIRSTLLLGVLVSAATLIVGVMLIPVVLPADKRGLVLPLALTSLALVPARQMSQLLWGVWQGAGRFRRMNVVRGLMNPSFLLMLLILWLAGATSIEHVVWVTILSSMLAATVAVCVAIREAGLRGPLYPIKKILVDSWRFGVTNLSNQIYERVDQIMLLWLLSKSDLGLYMVAWTAAGLVHNFASSIAIVAFTKCAMAEPGKGFPMVGNMIRKSLILLLLSAGGLAVVIPLLLPLLFGKGFGPAVQTAFVLMPGQAVFGIIVVLDLCMYGQGKPMAGLVGRIFAMIGMVLVSLVLAGPLGRLGVAIAYNIGQIICLSIMLVLVFRHFEDSSARLLVPTRTDIGELWSLMTTALRKVLRLPGRNSSDSAAADGR